MGIMNIRDMAFLALPLAARRCTMGASEISNLRFEISNYPKREATMARKAVGKTKDRGRTHIHADNMTTRPNLPVSRRAATTHPQGRGATMQRGDRRDMNRVLTNNDQRQPNLSNPAG